MANKSLKEYAASKGVTPPFSLVKDLYPKLEKVVQPAGDIQRNMLKDIIETGKIYVSHE
jgi:hypothetical protein